MWYMIVKEKYFVRIFTVTILLTVLSSWKASARPIEVYTVTGINFISEVIEAKYRIELLEITENNIIKEIPIGEAPSACVFNKYAELILDIEKTQGNHVVCRLTGFHRSDKLAPGWNVGRMLWKGDHRSTTFLEDPENSSSPRFSIEIRHRRNDVSAENIKRIRLLVVRISGPKGETWNNAFL